MCSKRGNEILLSRRRQTSVDSGENPNFHSGGNGKSFFRTVTFRLTLRYAVLFAVLSAAAFGLVYVMLASRLGGQMDERLHNSAKEFRALYLSHGLDALKAEFDREAQSNGIKTVFFRLLSNEGKTLAVSDLSAWRGLEAKPTAATISEKESFRTLSLPGRRHTVRVVSTKLQDGSVLQLGHSLKDDETLLERYRETFGWALAVMVTCGVIMGWLLARRAMAGVQRVTQTATQIGQGDLARRVPPGNEGAEIEQLARAFNDMLGRIQSLVAELKDVTNNIAHDLRSPITRLRGIAETTLTGPADMAAYREMAGAVVEESDRLVEMINTMLEIAQADSGMLALPDRPVDIGDVVRRACELFEPVAQDKGVHFESGVPTETLMTTGDISRLQRAIANLIDNALKFTSAPGRVRVTVGGDESHVNVTVEDSGIGIDADSLRHIFDRFYRADPSRSTQGNGLGLPLARSIVRAHGGDIHVTSRPGEGSVFAIVLPRSAAIG